MDNMDDRRRQEIWCAALEMVTHTVLSIRRVYPQESFCSANFLGLRCRVNRNPEVVEYISTTVQMAVSAVAAGESNELLIVIYDQETSTDHETYAFSFNENVLCSSGTTKDALESDIRNLILSVHALEGLKIPNWSPETSFRIMVLLSSQLDACMPLKDAISEGNWFCPGNASTSRKVGRRRPVHQMASCECQLYAEIG